MVASGLLFAVESQLISASLSLLSDDLVFLLCMQGKKATSQKRFLFERCLSMFRVGGDVGFRSSGEDNFANAVGET